MALFTNGIGQGEDCGSKDAFSICDCRPQGLRSGGLLMRDQRSCVRERCNEQLEVRRLKCYHFNSNLTEPKMPHLIAMSKEAETELFHMIDINARQKISSHSRTDLNSKL